MPMSATACRTSSNLNGLMMAVISFMHLSALSSVNGDASDTFRVVFVLRCCSFRATPEGHGINGLCEPKAVACTDMAQGRPSGALGECNWRANSGGRYELYQFE